MGWSIGYDENWQRDIGYGVPAYCDHPGCGEKIDRGLSYVCGGQPYGGERGCGLYFCAKHLQYHAGYQNCERCACDADRPFEPRPDHPEWVQWKLTDDSWQEWRDEHPDEVAQLRDALAAQAETTGENHE